MEIGTQLNSPFLDNNCGTDLKMPSPEEKCSFFDRCFFSWLAPLIEVGRKGALTMGDLFPLSRSMQSSSIRNRWEEAWKKRMIPYGTRNQKTPSGTSTTPSILRTFLSIYWKSVIFVLGLRIVKDCLQYTAPLLLTYLLTYVSDSTAPLSNGIAIVIVMFCLENVLSLLNTNYVNLTNTNATRLLSALQNSVFRKALRLSSSSRNRLTIGEIVNHLSVDCETIFSFAVFACEAISCPFQIILGLTLLYRTVGMAAIPGILLMFLFVPLNFYSSKFTKGYQMKLMKLKDERVKISNELLNSIKLVKLYAWEEAFEKRINEIREEEVGILQLKNFVESAIKAANNSVPLLVTVVTFTCFIHQSDENVLTPKIAFVCISIVNLIRLPTRFIGMLTNSFVQASVSLKRLQEFFVAEEIEEQHRQEAEEGFILQIQNGSFNWRGSDCPADIKNIDMNVREGEFVTIVGSVGSGKSSVLNAILGEMYTVDGTIRYSGRIAYVPQQAWLLNTTLRDNITFGKEFDRDLYDKVVDASELMADFNRMTHGDMTEVGENGVTLSGGQKARISIARALYQECDIYLLDDCLSAVDAHVGEAVYSKAFGRYGILNNRTRILVTHALRYTNEADHMIVMKEGVIAEEGKYNELCKQNGFFAKMIGEHEGNSETVEEECDEEIEERSQKPNSTKDIKGEPKKMPISDRNTDQIEKLATGSVKCDVYLSYLKPASTRWSLWFLVVYSIHIALAIQRSLSMSEWSNEQEYSEVNSPRRRLSVFARIGMGEVASLLVAQYVLTKGCQRASTRLHGPLLHSILRSPMSFFDRTPIGRILNRLSEDLDTIDSQLPVNISNLMHNATQVLMTIFLISYSTPLFLVAVIPLGALYYHFAEMNAPTVRQLRRLTSARRSNILSMLGESIQGSASIRAYGKVNDVCHGFSTVVDQFINCRHLTTASKGWLALRTEVIANLITLFAGLGAVLASRYSEVSPGIVGMCMSYVLSISDMMYMSIRMRTELETNIVAVERVEEYSNLDEEAAWTSANSPPENWPTNGQITWESFSTRYGKSLPLVLTKLTAQAADSEKVGIVGRTGSGKSSLTLALYRLIEPSEGTIFIDGIDISKIGLHELRSKLTIIPQEPVLFSGSLRFNLDPFGQYSDKALWKVLEECQLKEFVMSQPGTLHHAISEGGKNMSVGQRQLVCLGRALLKRGKILILDEATAACDVQTDAIVQKMVREQFSGSTVIAIAHRLHTIANYNRILVLERGNILEFDSPQNLLADPRSAYSRMIEKTRNRLKS